MRSTVVDADAMFFGKMADNMNFAKGSVTLAYRPMALEGSFAPDRLTIGLTFGGDVGIAGDPVPVRALEAIPVICDDTVKDGLRRSP